MRTVVVYPDLPSVATATAARLLLRIGDVMAQRDQCHVSLTGGTLGIATLKHASQSPLAHSIDWTGVHMWWSDERFVSRGHDDRNEGQAQRAMLRHLPLPEENIHRMGSSDDFDSPHSAAAAYLDEIAASGNPAWDVLLLGLGPDGHVASLFPEHRAYTGSSAGVVAIEDSPKPPATRVTMGLSTINQARDIWVIASGEAKATVVAKCLDADMYYPGAAVAGTEQTLWLIDAAAATQAPLASSS